MSIYKIGAIALAICSTSVFSKASFEDLRENYQREPRVNTSHVNTAQSPGWAVLPETPPQSTWKPEVDLSNSYGAPQLKLDYSTGNTSATGGVNSDVKEYVAQEIAKVSGGSGGDNGWEVVYMGEGTKNININGDFQRIRGILVYDEAYKTGITKSIEGVYGEYITHNVSSTSSDKCHASASVTIKFPITNTITVPGDQLDSDNCYWNNGSSIEVSVRAAIRNAKITSLEVYR